MQRGCAFCFNGAAPARARKSSPASKRRSTNQVLQWGRARAGAEISRTPCSSAKPMTASMGPRPRGRGNMSACRHRPPPAMLQWGRARAGAEIAPSVTPSGASPQYLNCDSLRCFECLYACDVWLSRHYQLVLRRLRHASAGGVFRITSPLAG